MRARDGVEHLHHQAQRLTELEPSLGLQDLAQRGTGHVLEHGVQQALAELARVDEPHDVWVRERGAEPHLTAEALPLVLQLGWAVFLSDANGLQRDVLRGRQLPRPVHSTEAARADLAQDLVPILEAGSRPEGLSGLRRWGHAGRECGPEPGEKSNPHQDARRACRSRPPSGSVRAVAAT